MSRKDLLPHRALEKGKFLRGSLVLILLVLAAALVSACDAGEEPPSNGPTPVEGSSPSPEIDPSSTSNPSTPLPTPSPDPRLDRTLVVCLGEEPVSLFPFGNTSDAAQAVMQAVYDGPIDRLNFQHQPVILAKLPALDDGDAQIQPVPVAVGDTVVDAQGSLVTLAPGSLVRPSGCYSEGCAVAYDEAEGFSMDQMTASYRLLEGLQWSDGAPLTASDSVYSFNLAAAPETPGSKFKIDRTASYLQVDDQTVEWRGVPGYVDPNYQTNFWRPLPEHSWGALPPAELVGSEISSRIPLSYGPYVIEEWVDGDHIQLRWNRNYFRAAEGLPRFENLVFRFIDPREAQANLDQLLTGECDIMDRTNRLDAVAAELQGLASDGRVSFTAQGNLDWEQVTFGIAPASYDDGFNGLTDRPSYFGDPRTRQAIAMCMDRESVLREVLFGASEIPLSYVAPANPLAAPDVAQYSYDPEAGAALLEEAGWVDDDGDPDTPRVAQGVENAPFGSRLAFTYLVAGGDDRLRAAEILTRSMAPCGISAEVVVVDEPEVYAPGPEGPLFGRQFDMGQFAWRMDGEPACFLFLSDSVPGEPGLLDEEGQPQHAFGWGGWNLAGYRSLAFDMACRDARAAIPGSPGYFENHQAAQAAFAEDLPAVPLYMRLNVAATRPDMCNFTPDPSASSDLWNLEELDFDVACE